MWWRVHGEGVHGEDVHGEGVYGEGVHAKKHAAKGRCKTCEDRGDETDHLQLVLLLFLLQRPVSYLLETALGVKSKEWLKEQGHRPPSSISALTLFFAAKSLSSFPSLLNCSCSLFRASKLACSDLHSK